MAEMDPAEPATATVLHAAIPGLIAGAARDTRIVSEGRAEIGKLLAAKDMRKLSDADSELNVQISRVTAALSEDEKAAAAWQNDLADASKYWVSGLAELSKVDPDSRHD